MLEQWILQTSKDITRFFVSSEIAPFTGKATTYYEDGSYRKRMHVNNVNIRKMAMIIG